MSYLSGVWFRDFEGHHLLEQVEKVRQVFNNIWHRKPYYRKLTLHEMIFALIFIRVNLRAIKCGVNFRTLKLAHFGSNSRWSFLKLRKRSTLLSGDPPVSGKLWRTLEVAPDIFALPSSYVHKIVRRNSPGQWVILIFSGQKSCTRII